MQQVKEESKAADKTTDNFKIKLDKTEKDLTDTLSSTDLDLTLDDAEIKVDYSHSPEEMFLGFNFSYDVFSDYLKAVTTTTDSKLYVNDNDNDDEKTAESNNSETLDDREAETTMQEVCVAYITGAKNDVDYITRKKLSTWIAFNSALFCLYESQALSRDVNYTEM